MMLGSLSSLNYVAFYFMVVLRIADAEPIHTPVPPCIDETGRPVACFPPFVNPAYGRPVIVTNTCGETKPEHYCLQTGLSGTEKWCDVCDATDEERAHPSKYLTDHHTPQNLTWWQSSTMLDGDVQYPHSVNLTIELGKSFEITYVRLIFRSSRPESFAIYKKVNEQQEWMPMQYYSSTCRTTYGMEPNEVITAENEVRATCRDDFSDISPLTDGNVAFSSLEGRPSAYAFATNSALQDWVTAKYIMFSLNRLNTFRDEVFLDPISLSSYFYAISEISLGGRCKCHGHADACVSDGGVLRCLCQHNTGGDDCEKCLPFFNDQPWRMSSTNEPFQCQPCNCNGLSETCDYDPDLHQKTGHGGHCTNCRENTSGPRCDICQEGFYRSPHDRRCIACHCHHLGSQISQCDESGQCYCRPGVTGEKCDRCLPYHYDLTSDGCTRCRCHLPGVIPGAEETCDPVTGHCNCKIHVTGRDCDDCITGHYGLSHDNKLGCNPCLCYGHSDVCTSDNSYSIQEIKSTFRLGSEGWHGMSQSNEFIEVEHLDVAQEISLASNDDQTYYFVAPHNFLGDILNSRNLLLSFNLRVEGSGPAQPGLDDVVLLSTDGQKLSSMIFSQGNSLPDRDKRHFQFVLGEHDFYQWQPHRMSTVNFGKILSSISAIKIRANYAPHGVGFLSNVTLETALRIPGYREAIVESCQCPEGYGGQFCEYCAPGYKRYHPNSGSFSSCVPCQCNNHSDTCDSETGLCNCRHNTKGLTCEQCADGFYGDALKGTPDDCQPCNCPRGGRCTQIVGSGEIVCLDCDEGYGGLRCDVCNEGFYKRYDGSCMACDCNKNVDENAIGNCDRETGRCLKCLYETAGDTCHLCRKGFFGEPLKRPHGECQSCECSPYGSQPIGDEEMEMLRRDEPYSDYQYRVFECDIWDGQCRCRRNVVGKKCDACLEGTWGLYSGEGCEDCECDRVGSYNSSCDVMSGQCHCKPGVTGVKCDQCIHAHYGFSEEGCKECKCNYYGSLNETCDLTTGTCYCRDKYVGRACDQCDINFYDLPAGCRECPVCYQLLLEPYQEVLRLIEEMKSTVRHVENLPPSYAEDDEKREEIHRLMRRADELKNTVEDEARWDDVRWINGLSDEIQSFKQTYENALIHVKVVEPKLRNSTNQLNTAKELLEGAHEELRRARTELQERGQPILRDLEEVQEKSGKESTRMTEIAREARDVVEGFEKWAEEIHNSSAEAASVSRQSAELVGNLRGDVENLERELSGTLQRNNLLKQSHERTVNDSAQSRVRASAALDASRSTMDEVAETSVDVVDLEATNTTRLQQSIKDSEEELTNHINQERELYSSIPFEELRQKLETARMITEERKRLMTTAQSSFNDSLGAQAQAEKVVDDAREMLATFKTFDETVQESKDVVDETKRLVPEIQKNLKDAENFTSVAHFMLGMGDIQADAEQSESLSVAAVIQVYNSTEDLEEILAVVTEHQNSSDHHKNLNSQHLQKLHEIENEIKMLEEKNEEDEKFLEEKLDQLNSTTYTLANQRIILDKHTTTINNLIKMLKALSLEDDAELNKINEELDTADTVVTGGALDEKYQTFVTLHGSMQKWVHDYEEEVKQLQMDVENLRQIRETIPSTCFKTVLLEPAGL